MGLLTHRLKRYKDDKRTANRVADFLDETIPPWLRRFAFVQDLFCSVKEYRYGRYSILEVRVFGHYR